jgi:hypothetical protein
MVTARPDLSDEGILDWEELIVEYTDVFATEHNDYGQTVRVYHPREFLRSHRRQ